MSYAPRARAAGSSYREIANEIDVSIHTLMGWRSRTKTPSVVQPIRVTPAPRESTAVGRSPRGLEVAGLSVVESFFASVKQEFRGRHNFATPAEVKCAMPTYINDFCNSVRIHSTLEYLCPIEFELGFTILQ